LRLLQVEVFAVQKAQNWLRKLQLPSQPYAIEYFRIILTFHAYGNMFVHWNYILCDIMAFRADESAANGYEKTKNYLIPRRFRPEQRERSERVLQDVVAECGPVVHAYPSWHPLVAYHRGKTPETYPNDQCGYQGLDHTCCFVHGFITCPYGDGDDVIRSAQSVLCHGATITAERLEVSFYKDGATPILVKCEWNGSMEPDGTIPKRLAVPLMLEQELPAWRRAERPETWETMRPYLLGEPHGSRSSLFVNQDTALAIKKIYLAMIESGMFGPRHVWSKAG
jgi:hypothetical protein